MFRFVHYKNVMIKKWRHEIPQVITDYKTRMMKLLISFYKTLETEKVVTGEQK